MSVVLKENLQENLVKIFDELPVELVNEVLDFAEFLREKEIKNRAEEGKNERIAGLNKGEIWMSDDFNDELPDDFWVGENGKMKEKNDESVD